jgi:NitT/TauT family transport system ATP-binding protein
MDNVAFGLQIRGITTEQRNAISQGYIELVGLSGFENSYPHELSGGMRQRANLARAFAIDPAILLMDEPFASLDAQTREVMQFELFRIWEKSRKTVLFVTHQIDEAIFLSDQVVVLGARPGTLRDVVNIDIARPRALEAKRTAPFMNYMDRIWKQLEGDVRRQMVS